MRACLAFQHQTKQLNHLWRAGLSGMSKPNQLTRAAWTDVCRSVPTALIHGQMPDGHAPFESRLGKPGEEDAAGCLALSQNIKGG